MVDYYGEEDGWTRVNYHRGRLQLQPHTAHRREEQHPRRYGWSRGNQPLHASITRGNQRHYGESPTFHSYRHDGGWRPSPTPPADTLQRSSRNVAPRYLHNHHTGGPENQRQPRHQPTNGHTARSESRPQVRVASDDPDFTLKVRVVYRIIKAIHHLNNVSGQDPPVMIARTTYSLINLIKPASPSDVTQLLLEGNAKNWQHSALLILQQHYEQSMNQDVQTLAEFSSQEWRGPFEVATVWARKNLGRRLRSVTLQDTEAFLVAHLTHQQQPIGTARGQSIPLDTEVPHANARAQAQIHTAPPSQSLSTPRPPPASDSPVSVATMTDQRGGDWPPPSPDDDEAVALLPLASPLPRSLSPSPFLSPPPPPSLTSLPLPSSLSSPPPPPSLSSPPPRSRRQLRDNSRSERSTAGLTAEQQTAKEMIASTTTSEPLSTKPAPRGARSSSLPPLLTPEPLHSEEGKTAAPRGATTPRKKLQQLFTRPSPVTPTQRPIRHGNTDQRDKKAWRLCAKRELLIMGDANVGRIPPFQREDLQIDSYPGATFHHAEAIIRRSKVDRSVKTLILSFGLNNRHQKAQVTIIKQLRGAIRAAAAKFPEAHILIPEVNFPSSLPVQQRLNLRLMNDFIKNQCMFIPNLPTSEFETESGGVRWSPTTASCMFNHWIQHLYNKSFITE